MSLKNNIDLANVREVICVALNYIGHVEEVENQFDKALAH